MNVRPTPEQLARIAEKHGLAGLRVRPMASTGEVNWIYAVGEVAVLRVARRGHPDWVNDARTESVAVPAVRTAGVRTPALLAFDDSRDTVDVPYTIYERAPGRDLGRFAAAGHIYREVGRELARLHRDVTDVPDPNGWLDRHGRWFDFLDDVLRQGFLHRETAATVEALFERVVSDLIRARRFHRFLHQDLKSSNIMACDGEFSAIIDWGDAGWGDPALEFRYLPVQAAQWALTGYREIMPLDGDDTAEARILWDLLCDTLAYGKPSTDQADKVARLLNSAPARRWLARADIL